MVAAIHPGSTPSTMSATAAIVRDIARGGLAGLLVGMGLLGPGARLVMRLHALFVPAATGMSTENGNRIGEITLGGTVGLLLIAGLFGAITLGVLWVVISPWLPGGTIGRGVAAVPVAVALGAHQLIVLGNQDFIVLRHEPFVVITLLALIGALPVALSAVDAWLDRRLPQSGMAGPAGVGYLALTILGGLLGAVLTVQLVGLDRTRPLGTIVIAMGLVTVTWWIARGRGATTAPPILTLVARTVLVAGTIAGAIAVWPALRFALPG